MLEVKSMTKSELIQAVSEKTNKTKNETEMMLNATLAVITETLAQKREIRLVGFGSFKTRHSAARTGKNPKTGELIQVSASYVPVFKPGQPLKEAVNV